MPINNLNELNEKTPLNLWCKGLAEIYKDVTVSDYPMFRWMQFVNDVTILSEEIRRRRYGEAINQVANILGRFLDFIGAYLNNKNNSVFPNTDKKRWKVWGKLSELLTASFQLKSYENELPVEYLPEGLTRWILAKYPEVCAKCGKKPCHCVVEPWIFEDRRENPGPYKEFKNNIEKEKRSLKEKLKNKASEFDFTLGELFSLFNTLYRNSYYKTDPWQIAMHLNEEVGEATTELTRLELVWLAPINTFNEKRIKEIKEWTSRILEKKLENTKGEKGKEFKDNARKRLKDLHNDLESLSKPKNRKNRDKLNHLFENKFDINKGKPEDWIRLWFIWKISEKFKEELADIASWIVAIACKLSEREKMDSSGKDVIAKLSEIYTDSSSPGRLRLRCRSCGKPKCDDKCLVEHSCSKELLEYALVM